MKKTILKTLGISLILATVAFAAASSETIRKDILKLGQPGVAVSKSIEFDTGAGANNVQVGANVSEESFIKSTFHRFGRGVAETLNFVFDIGGVNNPGFRWNNATSKIQFSNDGISYNDVSSGGVSGGTLESSSILLNTNAGFEDGTSNWTASGGVFTTTTTAANVGFQTTAGSWDASAASQTLSNDLVTIPAGLYGQRCSLTWYYKGGDSNLKAQVHDGTSVIAESAAFSTSAGFTARQIIYFTCPSSGQLRARLTSTGDAALVYIDNVKLGLELGVAEYTWSGFHDEDCSWSRTNSAFGDPASDASCTFTERLNRNFGTVSSVAGLLPGITFTAPATGVIEICTHGNMAVVGSNTMYARLWDGTSALDATSLYLAAGAHSIQMGMCGHKSVTVGDSVTTQWQWGTTGAVNADLAVPAAGAGMSVSWTMKYIGRF